MIMKKLTMFKSGIITAAVFFWCSIVIGQTVVFSESMGTVAATTAIATHEANNGFDNDDLTMTDGGAAGAADIRATSTSSGYAGASGAANIWFAAAVDPVRGFAIEGINAATYTNLKVQFGYRKESASALPTISLDFWDGIAYVNVPFTFNEAAGAGTGWYLSPEISLPAAAQIDGLKLRWVKSGSIACRIDDVKLIGTATAPVLVSTPSVLTYFGYVEGEGPSASKSLVLTGENLDGTDVSINAAEYYEVSLDNIDFFGSLQLPAYNGSATNINTRIKAGLPIGVYSENISISGGGATNINVGLSGKVVSPFGLDYSNDFRSEDDIHVAQLQGFTFDGISFGGTAGGGYTLMANMGSIESPIIDFTLYEKIYVQMALTTFGGNTGQILSVLASNNGGATYSEVTSFAVPGAYENFDVTIDVSGIYNVADGRLKFEMTDGTNQIRFRDLIIEEYLEPVLDFAVTFNVDMGAAIAKGFFNPEIDFVDVAGSFNDWGAAANQLLRVGETDIYSFTTDAIFVVDEFIEFKFRINGDWGNAQPGMNAEHTVVDGDNVFNYEWDTPSIVWANLQWPPTAEIVIGLESSEVTYFAQVYIPGVTDQDTPSTALIVTFGGNNENTDPSTWDQSEFTAIAEFNARVGNNHEYKLTVNGAMFEGNEPGSVFVVSRFQYGNDDYAYGGYSETGGHFWDGTDNVASVFTLREPISAEINPTELFMYHNWPTEDGEIIITWNEGFEVTDFSYFDEDLADYVSLLPLYGPREEGGLWEIFDIDGLTASLVIYWENAPDGDPKSKENDLLVELINLKLDFLLGDPSYIDLSILMKTFDVTFAVVDELGDPVPTANIIFEPWYEGPNEGGNIVTDNNPVFEVFASYDYMYTIEAIGYNTVIGYIEGVAEDMIVDIVLEEVVSATIDPTSFEMFENWDNVNPEFLITWNDASMVTGMSYYEDSEALWMPLPETMWTVTNNDGTTATLTIDLDQSPPKGSKDAEYFVDQITWRVEFNIGDPAIGHANMFVKTFLVAVIAYDEAFTPIPTYTVELTPYYDGGNPGQIWDDTNNPSFEVWARGDYQYVVTAEGYFPAEGTILNVEADMPVDVLLTKMENEIIAVAPIADIIVDFGTEIMDVTLPSSVEVTLENAEIISLEVVWDGGTPLYDGFTADTYTFEGTITLIEGVVNTAGHTATVNVVVNPEKEIVSVETLMDIQVFVGTDVLDIGLPAAVEVTLDDASIIELDVTWDGGTPVYDGSVAGTYVFEGTINLITGVINSADHKAVIDVVVFEDEKIIASVETLDDITVYYGTDIMDVNLPASVEVTTTDLYVVNLDVIWDAGTPVYDGTTPDTYYFTGQLQLIAGYINPNDVIAEINVIVVNKEITAVAEIADISVEYGTIIGDVMLPATVEVTLDDESTIDLDVVWDGGTPAYDGNIAGTYAFVGTITLIDGIDNTAALTASANVIVEEEVIPDKEIVAVAAIADITVALGTVIGDLVLPATVEVTLDDDSTMDLDVVWDGGTPAFDGDVAGTYAFEGTLTLIDGIANTAAYTAAVNVIVEADEFIVNTFPYVQEFLELVAPQGWSVEDNSASGFTWEFNGDVAFVDSDDAGSGSFVHSTLYSPKFDVSSLTAPMVSFEHFFRIYDGSLGTVKFSVDDGATWVTIVEYNSNTGSGNFASPVYAYEYIEMTELLDGANIFQVAFEYNDLNNWEWYWMINTFVVSEAIDFIVDFSVVGGNGSIAATADAVAITTGDNIMAGSQVVFTAIPDTGYQVKTWTVNGTVVTSYTELTYTIPSLTADVNVTVEFEAEPAGTEFMLSWDVAPTATTPTYRAEHYSVWVSTTGTDVADFTMVYEETISTTHTNWEYQNRQVNITDYDGMNIYVAFRHHDVTDMDRIVIDNIEILMIDEESNEMIVFFEDFQEGVDNEEGEQWLPDGWLAIDADGDDFGWYFGIREGNGAMRSQSWDGTAGALTPDNWLITPSILLVEPVIEYFTVTFSVDGGNGTIAATVGATAIDSGDEVEEGSNVVFTATPDTDYIVKAWYLDGAVIDGETGTTYTYTNLDADIDVKVEFEYGNFIPGIDVTEVNVFPNPARTNTTIVSESMITEIIIVGVLGEVVYEQVVGDFTYNLNVTNFRSGLYFIRVVTENGIVTKRLLVN
jgi:hypothetical protein